MRGHVQKKGNSWYGVYDLPRTESEKRKQKSVKLEGAITKREAEKKLIELLDKINRGEYIDRSKITVEEWLKTWLKEYIEKSDNKRLRTKETYKSVVEKHLIPKLGHIQLQKLRPGDIQNYYNNLSLSPTTKEQHHAVLHQALKIAVRNERLILTNPAEDVAEKPKAKKNLDMQVWDSSEVKKFLSVAKEEGIQTHAFYATAIETGMRKGELCGLKWNDIDLKARRISVKRTLLKPGAKPVLGDTKTGRGRAIAISEELAELLRRHHIEQKRQKAWSSDYKDQDFVFAKKTGEPLQSNNIGQRQFENLINRSGVRKIRFHCMRHTCATLLLANGMNAKVVQERLGHSDVSMTLNKYSHVTPTMQEQAAQVMGSILN